MKTFIDLFPTNADYDEYSSAIDSVYNLFSRGLKKLEVNQKTIADGKMEIIVETYLSDYYAEQIREKCLKSWEKDLSEKNLDKLHLVVISLWKEWKESLNGIV